MTAAGDPLDLYEEDQTFEKQLTYYMDKGFSQLRAQIENAVRNDARSQLEEVWTKKEKGGHSLRGWILKVSSPGPKDARKTFQVFVIAGNLNRVLVRLTVGEVIARKDVEAFAKDFEGDLTKAWRKS